MPDREKVIGLLQEMAEYFRECRNNASFASKAENHFWELQNAANEAVELLKEQEARIEQLNSYVNGFSRDAMPVVRCKNCKWNSGTPGNPYCQKHSNGREPDWFCADGERKDK